MKKLNQTQQKKIERISARKAWFDKKFYLGPVLNILNAVWFSVILGIFSLSNQRVKAPLVVVSVTIILLCGAFNIVKEYTLRLYNKSGVEEYSAKTLGLYRTLLEAFISICSRKANRLIGNLNKGIFVTPDPQSQITEILSQLSNILSFLLSDSEHQLNPEDIYINMLYRFEDSEGWVGLPIEQRGATTEMLLTEESFFTLLMHGSSDYLFYNSKQDLIRDEFRGRPDGHYIPDDRDERDDKGLLKGSILGYRIKIRVGSGSKITAMLFASTFDTKFISEDNLSSEKLSELVSVARENIKKMVLRQIEPRLKIELCNLYNDEHKA